MTYQFILRIKFIQILSKASFMPVLSSFISTYSSSLSSSPKMYLAEATTVSSLALQFHCAHLQHQHCLYYITIIYYVICFNISCFCCNFTKWVRKFYQCSIHLVTISPVRPSLFQSQVRVRARVNKVRVTFFF